MGAIASHDVGTVVYVKIRYVARSMRGSVRPLFAPPLLL